MTFACVNYKGEGEEWFDTEDDAQAACDEHNKYIHPEVAHYLELHVVEDNGEEIGSGIIS